jgi:hypothetical protein
LPVTVLAIITPYSVYQWPLMPRKFAKNFSN